MNLSTILATAQRPAQDRTERFAARLDAYLPKLADDAARLDFLRAQEAHWQELYRAWAARVDAGHEPIGAGQASAWDFTLTIAAIGQRIGRLQKQPAHA